VLNASLVVHGRITAQDSFSKSSRASHSGYSDNIREGNKAPIVTDDSNGLWRRMILMKFIQKFEGDACDRDLPAKLRTDAARIFNLWLKGFADWHKTA